MKTLSKRSLYVEGSFGKELCGRIFSRKCSKQRKEKREKRKEVV